MIWLKGMVPEHKPQLLDQLWSVASNKSSLEFWVWKSLWDICNIGGTNDQWTSRMSWNSAI